MTFRWPLCQFPEPGGVWRWIHSFPSQRGGFDSRSPLHPPPHEPGPLAQGSVVASGGRPPVARRDGRVPGPVQSRREAPVTRSR